MNLQIIVMRVDALVRYTNDSRSRVQLDRPFVVSRSICSTEEREKGSSDHGNEWVKFAEDETSYLINEPDQYYVFNIWTDIELIPFENMPDKLFPPELHSAIYLLIP